MTRAVGAVRLLGILVCLPGLAFPRAFSPCSLRSTLIRDGVGSNRQCGPAEP